MSYPAQVTTALSQVEREAVKREQQPTSQTESRTLLIIPCFNEGAVIGQLLQEIHKLNAGYTTVVIDDSSGDSTSAVARTRSRVVQLVNNLGIGGAVQTGIKYALRHGYEFCIQIDGDGQHDPAEIAPLLQAYRERPFNIIIGSRYISGVGFQSTFTRRLGSRLISFALNRLFSGRYITDPTSGMRLLDRDAMVLFSRRYPQDFPEPVSLAWAMRSGLTVGETSVKMRPRVSGSSSISHLKPIAYMIRVLSYIVLARLIRTL